MKLLTELRSLNRTGKSKIPKVHIFKLNKSKTLRRAILNELKNKKNVQWSAVYSDRSVLQHYFYTACKLLCNLFNLLWMPLSFHCYCSIILRFTLLVHMHTHSQPNIPILMLCSSKKKLLCGGHLLRAPHTHTCVSSYTFLSPSHIIYYLLLY